MDSPTISPVSEELSANSALVKPAQKVLPSLNLSLIDLTRQFLNWPQFGKYVGKEEEKSPKKEEIEQETETSEYTLTKDQWTLKWPENLNDSRISQDTYLSAQNDPVIIAQNDTDLSAQKDADLNVQNDTDLSVPNDADLSVQNDYDLSFQIEADLNDKKDAHQNEQSDSEPNDQNNMDQKDMKRNSKVSFEMTDYSETTDETDKESEAESSQDKQPEFPIRYDDDAPTLILNIPPWTEDHEGPGEFDDLLYEIPSCTDSDMNVGEDVSDTKKWFIEPGNNRNYIKALINYNVNEDWPRVIKSKKDFKRAEQPRKFKWIVNYDNLNYIRSLLRPEVFERILKQDLLKGKETCASYRYREMLVE